MNILLFFISIILLILWCPTFFACLALILMLRIFNQDMPNAPKL